MNAPSALRATARRAGRFNLWALVAIIALFGVFAVKAAMDSRHVPSRFFTPAPEHETPQNPWWHATVEKP
jgi:ABC-type sugar transport system substrate-binding protein